MLIKKYKKLLIQIILFGIVGVVSLLIDLAVTNFLYHVLDFEPYLAGVIGFLSAFFFNFPVNRKHVFNHSDKDKLRLKTQIGLYVALSVFNIFMTGLLMQLTVASGLLDISIAKICVTALIAAWNFVLYKTFIFAKHA
jgi:putative flippase GtrA